MRVLAIVLTYLFLWFVTWYWLARSYRAWLEKEPWPRDGGSYCSRTGCYTHKKHWHKFSTDHLAITALIALVPVLPAGCMHMYHLVTRPTKEERKELDRQRLLQIEKDLGLR